MSLLAMTGASQQNKDPAVTSRTKSPMKKRKKNQPQSQQQQQNPHPPPQKKQRVMSKILHERPEHFVGDESSRLSARYMEKFAKLIETQPPGFQRLLEKMLRAMFLRRPINIYVFFADFLEAELDRRTLAEIQFGCICYEGTSTLCLSVCVYLSLCLYICLCLSPLSVSLSSSLLSPPPALSIYVSLCVSLCLSLSGSIFLSVS